MITQVVIPIPYQDIEDKTAVELCEVGFDVALRALVRDQLHQIDVAGASVTILPFEQGHRRNEQAATVSTRWNDAGKSSLRKLR